MNKEDIILEFMKDENYKIVKNKKNRYRLIGENYVEGIYRKNQKGFGFVKIENQEDEIYISKEDALNAFMGSVEEALVNGEKVQLVGFGTFETRERAARQGRNPRDPQQVINIPASKAPVFKAGKSLKEAINA